MKKDNEIMSYPGDVPENESNTPLSMGEFFKSNLTVKLEVYGGMTAIEFAEKAGWDAVFGTISRIYGAAPDDKDKANKCGLCLPNKPCNFERCPNDVVLAADCNNIQSKLTAANEIIYKAENILMRIADYGPPQGERHDGIACAFCDMGGSGYASRGDGYHDERCAVKDAQVLLKEWSTSE